MSGRTLRLKFSKYFDGVVWKMLAIPQHSLLILELRDENRREVKFSACDYTNGHFWWENVTLEEPWWINTLAANEHVVVYQIFEDLKHPEQKSLIIVELKTARTLLRKDNFTFRRLMRNAVEGILHEGTEGVLTTIAFDVPPENDFGPGEISSPVLPFHYLEGAPYFETVKKFVALRQRHEAVGGAEYLEYEALIIISYYVRDPEGLTNYIVVLHENGDVLLSEKLGDHLKGLGSETFFAVSGSLFFVRNQGDLLSYKIEN